MCIRNAASPSGPLRQWQFFALTAMLIALSACGISHTTAGSLSYPTSQTDPLTINHLTGDTQPVRDPSIIKQGATYYLFATDIPGQAPGAYLPIRCSQNKVSWKSCGSIFSAIPAWVRAEVPGITGLWAPDISFFNGLYHVYYTGSTLGSQRTIIGLATNTTLDPSDPAYKWLDKGEVLRSVPGDDFNALDPNVLIDTDGQIWLTYGSYWSGIKQLPLDPATGKLLSGGQRVDLATRPGVPNDPIEGASLVKHGSFYYLFVSLDYCCAASLADDDYKEAVGRSTSPNGPFVDIDGTPMMDGGGTVLLSGNGTWNAPGGGTVYLDPALGESSIVFHALNMLQNGTAYVWLMNVQWVNDWPVLIAPSTAVETASN